MRLTILSHFPGRGGSTTLLRQLWDFFVARGHETTVLVGAEDPQPALPEYQVVPAVPGEGWRARLARYQAAVTATRPDLVYSVSGRDEMDLLRFLPYPRVRHCSSLEQQERADMFHWLKQMAGLLEGISANTPDVLGEIQRRRVMTGEPLLAPYRINPQFFAWPDTDPCLDRERPLEICFVGRLEPLFKRAHWLPEIARRCQAGGRQLRWHFYGDGELEASLQAGMPPGLAVFHGWVDSAQLASQLAAHDLFFLCSHSEGLPIAMVEAMLCGVACVVPAIPAGITFVLQKSGGWMYEATDPQAAAATIILATGDREVLREKRREAQRTARALFAPALVQEQMLRLEARLLALRFNGRTLDLARAPKFHAVPVQTFLRRKIIALGRWAGKISQP